MFQVFKIKNRVDSQYPKNTVVWTKHLLSELIGTIWLSLSLAGLSIFIKDKVLEHHVFLHNVIVGFYAGFIAVGSALFIFVRWSCDLNPAVTIYRWINGQNTTTYAFAKIIMQFAGAIVAGLIIYGIGKTTSSSQASNSAISALASAKKDFISANDDSLWAGGLWIFFGEMVMTAILLFPIFSPRISNKYRDLMIMFVISLSVWMGILLGTAAINPARGLAQQVPDLFFGINNGSTSFKQSLGNLSLAKNDLAFATAAMMLGGLIAPIFYGLIQGITQRYINNMIVNLINFKNNKHNEMKK